MQSFFALVILAISFASFSFARDVDSNSALLETGSAKKLVAKGGSVPNELKIVTFNMRWRGGDDLIELIKLLKEDKEIGGATVIGLQEVDRNRKRTNGTNTAKKMAEELGMYYAWAAPPRPLKGKERDEEQTGVAILSPYPLTDPTRIVLPNPGPDGRRRVALGVTVQIGDKSLRFYSVHAETRTTNEKRIEQFQAVLDDSKTNHAQIKQSIVVGDFNTITSKDVNATSHLFTENGFHTPFSNSLSTWKTFIIELKLDWMWLNGLDVKDYGIDKKVEMSDHWPLWAVVRMNAAK